MIHVWHIFAPILPEGQEAIEEVAEFIKYNKDYLGSFKVHRLVLLLKYLFLLEIEVFHPVVLEYPHLP